MEGGKKEKISNRRKAYDCSTVSKKRRLDDQPARKEEYGWPVVERKRNLAARKEQN